MIAREELNTFLINIQEDINTQLVSAENGTNPEQLFTEYALELLSEAGETENYRICYDEKISKRGVEHKLNAYALYENYETLDLFVSIYNAEFSVQTVHKPDIDKAFDRLEKFFSSAMDKGYVNDLEESSEVFDLAQTLAKVPEIKEYLTRINIFVLTNGQIKADLKVTGKVSGYFAFFRAIDINYLFNLSEKSRLPIELDFEELGLPIPCISSNTEYDGYQSYLSIIPGSMLAHIYEQYGMRLLEKNVRSFLQFTGKINRGIRNTILKEPHMFLAFNNGISVTADKVELVNQPEGQGQAISKIVDFQIVNGGQTTAAIYHAWKKYNASISGIYVQMKLTTIRNEEELSTTVSRIAEYANTQNKISVSDLSANKESLVRLEHLSRTIWAPPKAGETNQTRWFFERARGQYKNERIINGTTPSKRKSFDMQNPRSQMFTKELLAKYVNSFKEKIKSNKIIIGPYHVVRGGQKNFAQFMQNNFPSEPDEVYFQDTIAKAIIFKSAEKTYGIKPNSIGDMRYITVPYSISWLTNFIRKDINLYLVWKKQDISDNFRKLLFSLMQQIDDFIIGNAPGALYGEWAKKEDCWQTIKAASFDIELDLIKEYFDANAELRTTNNPDFQADKILIEQKLSELKGLSTDDWKKIYLWCKQSDSISLFLTNMAHTIGRKIRDSINLSSKEILVGSMLLGEISKKSRLLEEIYESKKRK
jgi:hypothetical protein